MMDTAIENKPAVVFNVDHEHGALRLSIVLVFIVGWVLAFMVLNALIVSEGLNIIALIVGFGITALLTQRIEKILKQRWPSGRRIRIEDHRIRVIKKGEVQDGIDASQAVNVLLWRFVINRRSRVPKGWMMVACALEQDETYLPVYTFMSPDDFAALSASGQFPLLRSKKALKNQDGSDMRLAGEQRRLHSAESVRWITGAEMTCEDFKQFISQLQKQFPQWMPSVI